MGARLTLDNIVTCSAITSKHSMDEGCYYYYYCYCFFGPGGLFGPKPTQVAHRPVPGGRRAAWASPTGEVSRERPRIPQTGFGLSLQRSLAHSLCTLASGLPSMRSRFSALCNGHSRGAGTGLGQDAMRRVCLLEAVSWTHIVEVTTLGKFLHLSVPRTLVCKAAPAPRMLFLLQAPRGCWR